MSTADKIWIIMTIGVYSLNYNWFGRWGVFWTSVGVLIPMLVPTIK